MEFGKKYALQRRVMKLRAREGLTLKQAWKKVLGGKKKGKKGKGKSYRTGPCRSPLNIRDKRTHQCRRKKNLGPSLAQLQQLALSSGVPVTKKLANGMYGRSPVKRAVLKARLTKAGVNYGQAVAVLQPLVSPSPPPASALPMPTFGNPFGNSSAFGFGLGLKKCVRRQYRSPGGRCRKRASRPCLHPGMIRNKKTLKCNVSRKLEPTLQQLQQLALRNNLPVTKKNLDGLFGKAPVSKRSLKSRLTRAGVPY